MFIFYILIVIFNSFNKFIFSGNEDVNKSFKFFAMVILKVFLYQRHTQSLIRVLHLFKNECSVRNTFYRLRLQLFLNHFWISSRVDSWSITHCGQCTSTTSSQSWRITKPSFGNDDYRSQTPPPVDTWAIRTLCWSRGGQWPKIFVKGAKFKEVKMWRRRSEGGERTS